MYELLDAAGATLCDPLLIILLAVMMMPSGGGSSYVFSGKTDDVGFLLLKARAAARKLPCAHRRSAQGAQAFILRNGASGPPTEPQATGRPSQDQGPRLGPSSQAPQPPDSRKCSYIQLSTCSSRVLSRPLTPPSLLPSLLLRLALLDLRWGLRRCPQLRSRPMPPCSAAHPTSASSTLAST